MTTKQENKFTMWLTLKDYLTPLSAITNAIPGFSALYNTFLGYITQVQLHRDIQEGDKTGVTLNKTQLKELLVGLTADTSRKLVAFATVNSNTALEAEVRFSEPGLRKSSDTILKDRAQLVYNRANTNVAALATYNITPATLTTFLAAITAFQSAIPKPRLTMNDRKTATENIEKIFTQADDALDRMDKLVEIVRIAQPVFYTGYVKARKVVPLGSTSLVVKGNAIDDAGTPVKNAKVEIVSANVAARVAATGKAGEKLVKKTAGKGGFQLSNLPDGTYTATVSKSGYKTQTVTFSVTQGEMTKIALVMERA